MVPFISTSDLDMSRLDSMTFVKLSLILFVFLSLNRKSVLVHIV